MRWGIFFITGYRWNHQCPVVHTWLLYYLRKAKNLEQKFTVCQVQRSHFPCKSGNDSSLCRDLKCPSVPFSVLWGVKNAGKPYCHGILRSLSITRANRRAETTVRRHCCSFPRFLSFRATRQRTVVSGSHTVFTSHIIRKEPVQTVMSVSSHMLSLMLNRCSGLHHTGFRFISHRFTITMLGGQNGKGKYHCDRKTN